MKKYLFFAATAMLFAACSNEEITSPNTGETAIAEKAVGFDVYVPGATGTRAGLEGTMTTTRLQRSEANGGGFGVYAFLTEDAVAAAGDVASTQATSYTPTAGQDPNFMANEKILWNTTNLGWYYSPLKYWPNETDNDSQTTPAIMEGSTPKHLDRLTFFAYAPYVSAGSGATGITAITDNNGQLSSTDVTDPTIAWVANTDDADVNPDEGVDLLWGVAPAGGLTYTAVNGTTVTVDEGKPLINMIKPDVNTSMKFLFNHSLARFGFTVVAAVDQVSAGGELDPNTKITINSLKITGPFGSTGELNLNNGDHANVANWTKIKSASITGSSTDTGTDEVLTLTGTNATSAIAPHLRWTSPHDVPVAQPVVGVTTAKQDLLRPSTKWFNKLAAAPVYNPGKKYFTDAAGTTEAHASYTVQSSDNIYTESAGVYSQASGTINTPNYPADQTATAYYSLEDDETFAVSTTDPGVAGVKYYTKSGGVYTNVATPTWPNTEVYYTVKATKLNLSDIDFEYSGDIYEAERNYVYVVPTNNINALNSGLTSDQALALRTIEVQIEYYITTEDAKLAAGRAQTKNVITKEVVLPSLQNGKTYNLNMVLGLTSVKIEAEVDDWKVVNGQVDLPQNTAE